MSSRDRRPKASEIFQRSNLAFARKVGFQEAFPDIEHVSVEVQIHSLGGSPSEADKTTYTEATLGEYVDCTNPLCYRGGVSIGGLIREMVRSKATALETTKKCQGYEGSAGGRRKYRECFTIFQIKISIRYKTGDASLQSPTRG